MADLHMIQLGVMHGERRQRGTKAAVVRDRDDGWNSGTQTFCGCSIEDYLSP